MWIVWLCVAIVAWRVLGFAVWAGRKLFGPLLMVWLVPDGTFPRWLTRGDDCSLFGGRWLSESETAYVLGWD